MLSCSFAGCSDSADDNSDVPAQDGGAEPVEEIEPKEEEPVAVRKSVFPDNPYTEIPAAYKNKCENGGVVVACEYDTKDYRGSEKEYKKTALVYLPYGYDQDDTGKKYNVMYWMHGGGGSEKELLAGENMESEMKKILDNLIDKGDMEACIVVGVSYNNIYNGDATSCCKNYADEFLNDVVPAVEGKYNTYCESTDIEGIKASRLHRGFGGFSMGAACTWWMFEQCLEEIGYFLPVAGDSWCVTGFKGGDKKESAEYLRKVVLDYGMTKDDFYIYCGVGTNDDMAGPNMVPMVEEMVKLDDVFVECDNFKDGNFYFAHKQGGWHAQDTVVCLIYNGLPKFFG